MILSDDSVCDGTFKTDALDVSKIRTGYSAILNRS